MGAPRRRRGGPGQPPRRGLLEDRRGERVPPRVRPRARRDDGRPLRRQRRRHPRVPERRRGPASLGAPELGPRPGPRARPARGGVEPAPPPGREQRGRLRGVGTPRRGRGSRGRCAAPRRLRAGLDPAVPRRRGDPRGADTRAAGRDRPRRPRPESRDGAGAGRAPRGRRARRHEAVRGGCRRARPRPAAPRRARGDREGRRRRPARSRPRLDGPTRRRGPPGAPSARPAGAPLDRDGRPAPPRGPRGAPLRLRLALERLDLGRALSSRPVRGRRGPLRRTSHGLRRGRRRGLRRGVARDRRGGRSRREGGQAAADHVHRQQSHRHGLDVAAEGDPARRRPDLPPGAPLHARVPLLPLRPELDADERVGGRAVPGDEPGPRGRGEGRPVGRRRGHVGRARLRPAVGRVVRTPAPLRQGLRARPLRRGRPRGLEPRLLRLRLDAAHDLPGRRHRRLHHAEDRLERHDEVPAPALPVEVPGRLGGPDVLPVRLRGRRAARGPRDPHADAARAAARPGGPARPLRRGRPRRRPHARDDRADGRDVEDARVPDRRAREPGGVPRPRPREVPRRARVGHRALPRVPPRHVHDARRHEDAKPPHGGLARARREAGVDRGGPRRGLRVPRSTRSTAPGSGRSSTSSTTSCRARGSTRSTRTRTRTTTRRPSSRGASSRRRPARWRATSTRRVTRATP